MRLFRLVSLGLLAGAGLSCAADTDCGGPTSDWPTCNHDNGAPGGGPTSGNPDEGEGSPVRPSTPSKDGDTPLPTRPPAVMDAGVIGAPNGPSEAADAGTGDANLGDAGVVLRDDDASVPSFDGGSTPGCAFGSSADDAGGCYGLPCALPGSELLKLLCTTGHCLDVCSPIRP